MRDEAHRRIGALFPKVTLPQENGGGEATVIAWLWTRTAKCPNPACGARMPLTSKWWLSTKVGKKTWIEPQVDRTQVPPVIHFQVRMGAGGPSEGTVNRRGATCIACGTLAPLEHIRAEGSAGRMENQLLVTVADTQAGRVYVSPTSDQAAIAASALPTWTPETILSTHPQYMAPPRYGMTRHRDLFTARQLVALNTFSELIGEVRDHIESEAKWSILQ